MTDLQNLLDRVQAATGPDPELDGLVAKVAREIPPDAVFMRENAYGQESDTWYTGGYGAYVYHYPEPYTDSIDAALALANRLLPGCSWRLQTESDSEGFDAVVLSAERTPPSDGRVTGLPTPALAILAALFTALIANQKGTETK